MFLKFLFENGKTSSIQHKENNVTPEKGKNSNNAIILFHFFFNPCLAENSEISLFPQDITIIFHASAAEARGTVHFAKQYVGARLFRSIKTFTGKSKITFSAVAICASDVAFFSRKAITWKYNIDIGRVY